MKKIKKKKVGIGIAIFLAICCIIGCPRTTEDKTNISTTELTVVTTATTQAPTERQTTTTKEAPTSKPKTKSKSAVSTQSKPTTTIKAKEKPAQTKSNKDNIVYITNTGNRYHRESCRFLESKVPIDREEAINRGYSPCKTCKPDS